MFQRSELGFQHQWCYITKLLPALRMDLLFWHPDMAFKDISRFGGCQKFWLRIRGLCLNHFYGDVTTLVTKLTAATFRYHLCQSKNFYFFENNDESMNQAPWCMFFFEWRLETSGSDHWFHRKICMNVNENEFRMAFVVKDGLSRSQNSDYDWKYFSDFEKTHFTAIFKVIWVQIKILIEIFMMKNCSFEADTF